MTVIDRWGRSARRGRRALPAGVAVALFALGATGCIPSASVNGSVLTITGSGGADTIVLRLKAGDATTLEVDDANDGTADYSFNRATFTSIVVDAGGGDDVISVSQVNGGFTDTEITTLSGGPGNDQLVGGSGAETLNGGPGNDVLDGNTANDQLIGGDDADQFSWTPGEGSDTVDGGLGADRLAFTGSNIAEKFAFTNAAGHVQLTRDIAAIAMDLDGLETVDLALLGGTDTLTVNNLTGTDQTTLTADLAATGGFDDGALDEVRVPPSTVVGRSGAAATVSGTGVGALVRVVNGSPTDRLVVVGTAGTDQVQVTGTASPDAITATASGTDIVMGGVTPGLSPTLTGVEQLAVDLGAGNDQFSITGSTTPPTSLSVAGGTGRDSLIGSSSADVLDGGPGADVLDGNQANDTLIGGADDDVVTWDPGDGSDTIDGGAGTDQLTFNGSNVAEIIDTSRLGTHVRLTRNIGAVALDLVGIDSAELNLLGGADNLAVRDLTGTDLGFVGVNLASTLGGATADFTADLVGIDGTAGDDAVEVAVIGSVVEATGLSTVVRVTNADPSLDTLTVNGLAGTDTITSSPLVTTLILLSLLP